MKGANLIAAQFKDQIQYNHCFKALALIYTNDSEYKSGWVQWFPKGVPEHTSLPQNPHVRIQWSFPPLGTLHLLHLL